MGQLAFGAVGAVVGGYIGGPAGASWGWSIGSAIGGVVFAPDGPQTQGPRLEDLKSNVSTYGQPIPRCYGQIGFMGSLIWMDDLTEFSVVSDAGKGGDPATQTTFSYSASFAMILCRGEVSTIPLSARVKALNRIWVNEKCYYDMRDETNVEAVAASTNFQQYFRFYPGSQTQEPDPTMEAILGVGNVPAYRGRAYIVITDLPLAFVQNQPPGAQRWVFEVVMEGTPATGLRLLKRVATGVGPPVGPYGKVFPVTEGLFRMGGQFTADGVNVYDLNGNFLTFEDQSETDAEWPQLYHTPGFADSTLAVTRLYDGDHNVRAYPVNTTFNDAAMRLYATDVLGNQYSAVSLFTGTDVYRGVSASADQRHLLVPYYTPPDTTTIYYKMLEWDASNLEFIVESSGRLPDTFRIQIGASSQGLPEGTMLESDLDYLWWFQPNSAMAQLLVRDSSGNYSLVGSLVANAGDVGATQSAVWTDNGLAYIWSSGHYYVMTRNDGAATNTQTLQEVHEAECALAGLAPAQVDGSDLAGIIVDGMFVRRLGPTRGVIQTLEPAYFYDTYESSGVLNAKLRGGASIVTIEEEDLGASISGEAEEDLINPERADEDTLPGEVIVTYIDRASDYQVAAQHDRRSAVATEQPVSLEMPLVFTPDDARQIGAVWMYNQWIGRTRRTIKLSRAYSYLEPTDVITIETDDATFVVRIVAIKTNDGFLEVECVDEDAALYTQNAQGANVDQGTTIQASTPTRLIVLDIPMLREADDDPGFYIAASGYGNTWPGALVLRSFDGGVSYNTVASIVTQATIGSVASALGNYLGPMGYDAVNTITVSLFSSATLQSCTDAELLGGANACVIGSSTNGYEILQYKTATLVSGQTWLLSELLRGRRGTENEMAGHGAYETFVLLEASKLRRIGISDPAIGTLTYLKAVTVGQLASAATAISFTNTAAGLKPYSPVDARATGFGGDITITWSRRGRLYNQWRDGIDIPLGEATESYSIDIYNGASVIRTLTSSTPTVTYTAAQQATDWGSPNPSSLSVRIYQLSAIVGRGFPFIGTLS